MPARGDRVDDAEPAAGVGTAMRRTPAAALPAVVGLVLFVAALEVLRASWAPSRGTRCRLRVLGIPPLAARLGASCSRRSTTPSSPATTSSRLPTSASALPRWRIASLTSFLAYAIANNVGFAMLSGASVRYRFYTRWGVTAEELSRIVFFVLGHVLAGPARAWRPQPGVSRCPRANVARGSSCRWLAGALPSAWPTCRGRVRRGRSVCGASSCRCRRRVWPLRSSLLSAVDWALAGAVLYVLLPPSDASFLAVLGRVSRRRSCSGSPATCPAASACSKG